MNLCGKPQTVFITPLHTFLLIYNVSTIYLWLMHIFRLWYEFCVDIERIWKMFSWKCQSLPHLSVAFCLPFIYPNIFNDILVTNFDKLFEDDRVRRRARSCYRSEMMMYYLVYWLQCCLDSTSLYYLFFLQDREGLRAGRGGGAECQQPSASAGLQGGGRGASGDAVQGWKISSLRFFVYI